MTLTQRIQKLMKTLCSDFPERESCLQLGFLAVINNEPFYLYGRTGSGKNFLMSRLSSAFRGMNVLQMGLRQQEYPENIDSFDVVIFNNFNPGDENAKENVRSALQNRKNKALIISSDVRPENAMGRAEIADEITLTVFMPDNLSSSALCSLLQNQGELDKYQVPAELAISSEEKAAWQEDIKKVELSSDTLMIIGKLADLCVQNSIYVPISKWLSLANLAKAIAFFNGRNQTTFTDVLFLGTPIWGRSTSNNVVIENFNGIVKTVMLKDLAMAVENIYDAKALYNKVKTLLNSTNNLYETKEFNGEPCICYRITVAGESTPLYVPLYYVETNEDFYPYNELRRVEKHVRCNFHGTSSCTISIDSAVKGVGLRNNSSRNAGTSEKFEDFATLPTYILRENDPEVARQKKVKLEECLKEAQQQMEQQAKVLRALRDLYQSNKVYRTDLFCDTTLFDKIQGELRDMFDTVNGVATKLKETLELFSAPKSNN